MKTFKLNEEYEIVCVWVDTRYGFRHDAFLMRNGSQVGNKAKACYYNRTWESYEFASVIHNLIDREFNEDDAKLFREVCDARARRDFDDKFGMISAVMKIGEVICDGDKKAQNDWKKRMLVAGVKGIDFPDDWDTLSEDEKEARIKRVEKLVLNDKEMKA